MEQQIVICSFAVLTVCFFTPMAFFVSNYGNLDINLSVIFRKLVIISFPAIAALCLIPSYPDISRTFKKIYLSIIFLIGIFAFFQSSFIMNFIGKLDGRPFQPKYGIYVVETVFTSVMIGILSYFFKSEAFLTNIYKTSIWLLIAQTIFFIPCGKKYLSIVMNRNDAYWFKDYSLKLDKYNVYSKENNIAIVLMDGFGKGIFEELLTKYPEYKEIFKDFEFYPNTVSESPHTAVAVPALFTTHEPESINFNEHMFKEVKSLFSKEDALLKVLKENGYNNYIYPFFKNLIYLNSDFTDNIKVKDDYKIIDSTYNQLIRNIIMFYTYPFYKKKSSFKYLTKITMDRRSLVLPNDYFHEDDFYKNFLTGIKTDDEKKAFHFYHLRGLHEPFMLDENFKVRNLTENDPVETTAKLYMTMLKNYIDRLKEAGIYDKTAIIIMSDHGSGRFISPLQSEKELSINSLLLYKNSGTKQNEMKTVEDVWAGIIDISDLALYSAGITDEKWNLRKPDHYKSLLTQKRLDNLKNFENLQMKKISFEYTAEALPPSKIFTFNSINRSGTMTLEFPDQFKNCEKYFLLEKSDIKYFMPMPEKMGVFFNDRGDYILTTISFRTDGIPNWIYNTKFLLKKDGKYHEMPIGEISLEDNQMNLVTPLFDEV